MKPETLEKLKEIKRSFRLLMNGETSKYMRENGVNYHLNWGVASTDLRKMAEEYAGDDELAIELWKENIRECKILATMIMPEEKMTPQLADLWMEQTDTQEIAEQLALNVLHKVDFAPLLAFEWIAGDNALMQICGFHIIARRIANGEVPDGRGINEIIDQALTAMAGKNVAVSHAAFNCLTRLAQVGEDYEKIVQAALKASGLYA